MGWVVYEITGSGALLGAVMGARAIPMFLLTPLSGVAADRYDRKRLLQASQGIAAAVSLSFGAALAFGVVETWMLFAFTMLMGASNVIDRPAFCDFAFDEAEKAFGTVTILVNNAGIAQSSTRAIEVTPEEWRKVISVDLDAVFHNAQEAARRMLAAGKPGAIVNISSVLGFGVSKGVAAYATAKAA